MDLPGRKHQALVAYVLLSGGKIVTRERILGLLWGTRSDDQARASLRGVLSGIRHASSKLHPQSTPPIRTDRVNISFKKSEIEVDVDAMYRAAQSDSPEELAKAVNLYTGALLDSISLNEQEFEDWKQAAQQNIISAYRKTLIRYLVILENKNQMEELESIAGKLLELDGADEDAHRSLIKLYFHQGNKSQALHQLSICRNKLRSQYGTDASAETLLLVESLINNKSNVPESSAPNQQNLQVLSPALSTMPVLTVAIMRFQVLNSTQINADFGELISLEVIGSAAKFKWFRVLPSSDTFRSNFNDLSASDVSGITGAKYILFGKIREIDDKHKLFIELVDGINNRAVWSDRLEFSNKTLFYPDEIVSRVVGQLDVRIRASEIAQAHQMERKNLTSYQCSLLALSNMYDLSIRSFQDSEQLFAKAVKSNPNDSWFFSIWALWKMFCLGQAWAIDKNQVFERAGELARQAIKRDPDDALAMIILGHYESFWAGNLDQGKSLIDSSLKLNPYSSFAWMLSSATYSYCGEPDEALKRLEKSKLLCSTESHFEFLFNTANCIAHLFRHDSEQAAFWGYKAVRESPGFTNSYKHLLTALGHLRRSKECHKYTEQLLEIEPSFDAVQFIKSYPFAKESDREYFLDGLLFATAQSRGIHIVANNQHSVE